MGQQESPLIAPPRPLGSIRQIYVSEGRGFRTKNYPLLTYLGGGGTLGVTLDRAITENQSKAGNDRKSVSSIFARTSWGPKPAKDDYDVTIRQTLLN